MDYLLSIIKILLLVYIGALLLLYIIQPGLIYYPELPNRELQSNPGALGLHYEDVSLRTHDNVKLHGWYIPIKQTGIHQSAALAPGVMGNKENVLLFFHGNAGNISHRLDSIKLFHQLGYSVFIIDYRGYGNSEGKPSEIGTYRDADAAIQYLATQKNIPNHRVTVFGRSLGGAIAAYVATKYDVAALILESTFTSATDMASKIIPWPIIPVRLISRYSYNTAKRIEKIHCPILIIHSPDDEVIPFSHGEMLYKLAKQPKTFIQLRGGHNDGFLVSGDMYAMRIRQFLSTVANH